jgi:hypothetical protein
MGVAAPRRNQVGEHLPGVALEAVEQLVAQARDAIRGAATARTAKARLMTMRCQLCPGGSMKIMIPSCAGSAVIISMTVPCAELNVSVSRMARSTSSQRLGAKKSARSLRYNGAYVA